MSLLIEIQLGFYGVNICQQKPQYQNFGNDFEKGSR